MGLASYDEIKQSVITWSKRNDVDLLIDDFITLAETRMLANTEENLKVRQNEKRATATITEGSRFLALPDNFTSMRKLTVIFDDVRRRLDMEFKTPNQMDVLDFPGVPFEFAVSSQLEFNRDSDADYTVEMQYLAGLIPLTSSNQTNNVLAESPNVYLFGTLWALFRYAQDTEEEAFYLQEFMQAIVGANRKYREGKYGPRPVVMPRGTKP